MGDLRRGLLHAVDPGRPGGTSSSRSRRASVPIRWGRSGSARAGDLAFSYGNVAQDEGAADAQIAIKQGWKTADVATDKQIVYNVDTCEAFANKFKALGGKVVSTADAGPRVTTRSATWPTA